MFRALLLIVRQLTTTFDILGMSSLYSTLVLAIIQLLIITTCKGKSWLDDSKSLAKPVSVVTIIWCLALSTSLPPMLGTGEVGQDMVAVR